MSRRSTDSLEQPKERKGSLFTTEFRAGLATFFAMAYIISVNCMFTIIWRTGEKNCI